MQTFIVWMDELRKVGLAELGLSARVSRKAANPTMDEEKKSILSFLVTWVQKYPDGGKAALKEVDEEFREHAKLWLKLLKFAAVKPTQLSRGDTRKFVTGVMDELWRQEIYLFQVGGNESTRSVFKVLQNMFIEVTGDQNVGVVFASPEGQGGPVTEDIVEHQRRARDRVWKHSLKEVRRQVEKIGTGLNLDSKTLRPALSALVEAMLDKGAAVGGPKWANLEDVFSDNEGGSVDGEESADSGAEEAEAVKAVASGRSTAQSPAKRHTMQIGLSGDLSSIARKLPSTVDETDEESAGGHSDDGGDTAEGASQRKMSYGTVREPGVNRASLAGLPKAKKVPGAAEKGGSSRNISYETLREPGVNRASLAGHPNADEVPVAAGDQGSSRKKSYETLREPGGEQREARGASREGPPKGRKVQGTAGDGGSSRTKSYETLRGPKRQPIVSEDQRSASAVHDTVAGDPVPSLLGNGRNPFRAKPKPKQKAAPAKTDIPDPEPVRTAPRKSVGGKSDTSTGRPTVSTARSEPSAFTESKRSKGQTGARPSTPETPRLTSQLASPPSIGQFAHQVPHRDSDDWESDTQLPAKGYRQRAPSPDWDLSDTEVVEIR